MLNAELNKGLIGCFKIPPLRDYNRHLFGLGPKIQATRYAGCRCTRILIHEFLTF